MFESRYVYMIALASASAASALTFAFMSVTASPHRAAMAAAASSISSTMSADSPSMVTPPGSAAAMASSSTNSGTTSPPVLMTNDPTTQHQYKLLSNVDVCTLNTLGKDGWQPVQYGQNTDSNYLELAAGRDENCQTARVTRTFVWILFERQTP